MFIHSQQKYGDFTQDWMKFQPAFEAKETFKTTKQTSFADMGDRKDPFTLKATGLTKD